MAEKKKVELILATATKIEAPDSLVIFVDPQFADFINVIYGELRVITGHERHTVIPVPSSAVKIFKVQHQPMMTIDPEFAASLGDMELDDGVVVPSKPLEVNPKSHNYTDDKK